MESRSNCADSAVLWSVIRSRHAHAYVIKQFWAWYVQVTGGWPDEVKVKVIWVQTGAVSGSLSAKWRRTGTLQLLTPANAKELIEANWRVGHSCSKHLLNDVIFIRFSGDICRSGSQSRWNLSLWQPILQIHYRLLTAVVACRQVLWRARQCGAPAFRAHYSFSTIFHKLV